MSNNTLINITLGSAISFAVVSMINQRNKPNPPFTGYIVSKGITLAHWDNETPKYIYETFIYSPVAVPPPKHVPIFINTEWKWYIANKDEVISISVDSLKFNTKKCGEKITVFRKK